MADTKHNALLTQLGADEAKASTNAVTDDEPLRTRISDELLDEIAGGDTTITHFKKPS